MAKYLDSTGLTYLWGKITAAFQSKVSASGILKGDGSGGVTAAVSGTDYQAPLPSQTGNSGKFLTTNGSAMSWATVSAGTSDIFWITVTADTSGQTIVYSADKTYAQITAAKTAGQFPVVLYNDNTYYMSSQPANSESRTAYVFIHTQHYTNSVSFAPGISIKTLKVASNDTWSFTADNSADVFIADADDTLHSEILEAYNAGKMIFCVDPSGFLHSYNCNIYVPLTKYSVNSSDQTFIFSCVYGSGNDDLSVHSIAVTSSDAWSYTDTSIAPELPSQSGNSGEFLMTNGVSPSWESIVQSPFLTVNYGVDADDAFSVLYSNHTAASPKPVVVKDGEDTLTFYQYINNYYDIPNDDFYECFAFRNENKVVYLLGSSVNNVSAIWSTLSVHDGVAAIISSADDGSDISNQQLTSTIYRQIRIAFDLGLAVNFITYYTYLLSDSRDEIYIYNLVATNGWRDPSDPNEDSAPSDYYFRCVAGNTYKQYTITSTAITYSEVNLLNRTTAVNTADTNYTTYMARGEALNSTDTNPTANGCISWTYA